MAAFNSRSVRRSSATNTNTKSSARKRKKPSVRNANRPVRKKAFAKLSRNKRSIMDTISLDLESTVHDRENGPHIAIHAAPSSSYTTPYLSTAIKSLGPEFSKHARKALSLELSALLKEKPMPRGSKQKTTGKTILSIHESELTSLSIEAPEFTRAPFDVTSVHDDWNVYLQPSLRRLGDITFNVTCDLLAGRIRHAFEKAYEVHITLDRCVVTGLISSIDRHTSIDGKPTIDVRMRQTKPPVFFPAMKEEPKVKPKLKKFYVAHPKIGQPGDTWSKATLQEAIDHAAELMEREGRDEYYVVKIVKRVRKPKPKPIIETV